MTTTEGATAPQGDDWEALADSLAWALSIVGYSNPQHATVSEQVLGDYLAAKRRSGARDSAA